MTTENPEPLQPDQAATAAPGGRRKQLMLIAKIVGIALAAAAIYFCVKVLVEQWPKVWASIQSANVGMLVVAFLLGAGGVLALGALWWRCLAVFGSRTPLVRTEAWYLAGEMGKYLPGGIWPVVGRGEFARRDGVPRSIAYPTTLFSLALMCVGGAFVSGVLTLFFAFSGGRIGPELLLLLLIPIGVIGVHPAIFGRLLRLASKVTRGRIDLTAPSWTSMLSLIVVAVPTWVLIGAQAVVVTHALHIDQSPAKVAFAAVAGWIIGFLAIPVPAGAGIREVVFVLASGLAIGSDNALAVAVATICRFMLIIVDGLGGLWGIGYLRRKRDPDGARAGTPDPDMAS